MTDIGYKNSDIGVQPDIGNSDIGLNSDIGGGKNPDVLVCMRSWVQTHMQQFLHLEILVHRNHSVFMRR
jgi:hypothetical protein